MLIKNERDRLRAISEVKNLDLTEKAYRHTVKVYREIRTLSQNKLMWLWFKVIEFETGNDKDDLHDDFREQFLGFDIVKLKHPLTGTKKKLKSTTDLDTKQFTTYLDKIHLFMSERMPEIKLPDPNEKDFDRVLEYYSDVIDK